MAEDNLEVNLYVMGQYQGKRKAGKDSICGALLPGDISTGLARVRDMVKEINNIPGVQAMCELTPAAPGVADRGSNSEAVSEKPHSG